jgi:hypothetical protein
MRLKGISHDSKTWHGRVSGVYYDDTAAKWKGKVTLIPVPAAVAFQASIESDTYEGLPAAAKAALTA